MAGSAYPRHIHTYTPTNTHIYTNKYIYTHIHTTDIQACIYKHTHRQTRKHTHTHIWVQETVSPECRDIRVLNKRKLFPTRDVGTPGNSTEKAAVVPNEMSRKPAEDKVFNSVTI